MSGPEQKSEAQPEMQKGQNSEVISQIEGKTRQALDEMKAKIEKDRSDGKEIGSPENIAKNLDYIKSKTDLSPEQWEKVKANVEGELKAAILMQTTEGQALNAFAMSEPKTKTEKFFRTAVDKIKKFPELAKMLGEYLVLKAATDKKNEKVTIMTGFYEKMAGWLGYESPTAKFEKYRETIKLPDGYALGDVNDKNEVAINSADGKQIGTIKFNAENGQATLVTAAGSFSYKKVEGLNQYLPEKLKLAPAAAQTAENTENKAEQEKYAKSLIDKGWTLETSRFAADLKTLKDSKITDIDGLITEAFGEKGRLTQLLAEIKKGIPDFKNEMFKVSLADLLFQKMEDVNFQKILAVFKNEKDEYKFDKTPQSYRNIIDKFNSAKDADAIAAVSTTYKKQA